MQVLFQNSHEYVFLKMLNSIKNNQRVCGFFNFSIVEMKPQQQHHICMCILHTTCAGNMRCAAAAV